MHPRRSWRREQPPHVRDTPTPHSKTSPVVYGVFLGCASGASSFALYELLMGAVGSFLEKGTTEAHELFINYPLALSLVVATGLISRWYAKKKVLPNRRYYTAWALGYCCTNPLTVGVMVYVGAYKIKYALT